MMVAMDRVIAYDLLLSELAPYRGLAADELSQMIEVPSSNVKNAKDGNDYLVEIAVDWADSGRTSIRVSGTVGPADWGGSHDRLDEAFFVSLAEAETP